MTSDDILIKLEKLKSFFFVQMSFQFSIKIKKIEMFFPGNKIEVEKSTLIG
jgi:hypothetical protein